MGFKWFDKEEGEGMLGELGGMEGIIKIYQLTLHNFVIKITY
jgi:hypothetical protein